MPNSKQRTNLEHKQHISKQRSHFAIDKNFQALAYVRMYMYIKQSASRSNKIALLFGIPCG